MLPITNYQMSVFGDYAAIVPEIDLINKLVKAPIDIQLLPSTANIVSVDIPAYGVSNGQPRVFQRIQLIDTMQNWTVAIMPERIDVTYSHREADEPKGVSQVSEAAHELLKHIVSVCNAIYGRMAINLTIIAKPETDEKLTAFQNLLVRPLSFQSGKELIEWQVVANTPVVLELAKGRNEETNVICSFSRQNDLLSGAKFMVAHLDVNTSPVNMSPRFNVDMLKEFREKAITVTTGIIQEIEEKWSNA